MHPTCALCLHPMDLLDGVAPINGTTEIICHPIKLADGSLGDAYLPHGVSLPQCDQCSLPKRQQRVTAISVAKDVARICISLRL